MASKNSVLNRVPTFDGNWANFAVWSSTFHELATLRRFVDTLNKANKTELPAKNDAVFNEKYAGDQKEKMSKETTNSYIEMVITCIEAKPNYGHAKRK